MIGIGANWKGTHSADTLLFSRVDTRANLNGRDLQIYEVDESIANSTKKCKDYTLQGKWIEIRPGP